MRLNPRYPQLRGAANPNLQSRSAKPFQFVDPACRDTEDLGWKSLAEIKFSIFFRNDCLVVI